MNPREIIGQIVKLKDGFRIYKESGIYYFTKKEEIAIKISNYLKRKINKHDNR